MDVETAIRTRRSIRSFDPAHRIDDADATALIGLAALSPTAFNLQHWRFVVVRDPLVRFQLRQAAYDQAAVTDASLLIAICADVKAWDRNPDRCWREVDPAERDRVVAAIRRFYAPDPQLQRDEATRSCALAAQTLMLAAVARGHGTCAMDGFDAAAVARILNLPPDHIVSMFVAIGRPLEPAGPRPGTIPAAELTATDRFSDIAPVKEARWPHAGPA
ncbi:MAG: nitroreductase family protein [Candidatus Krumholzibacteriia bacterium]